MLKSIKCEPALRSIAAFSLVEVTLALGIAAFCLIAVFGLMPVGVQTNRNATSQTAATNIIACGDRGPASDTESSTYVAAISPSRSALRQTVSYFDGAGTVYDSR